MIQKFKLIVQIIFCVHLVSPTFANLPAPGSVALLLRQAKPFVDDGIASEKTTSRLQHKLDFKAKKRAKKIFKSTDQAIRKNPKKTGHWLAIVVTVLFVLLLIGLAMYVAILSST